VIVGVVLPSETDVAASFPMPFAAMSQVKPFVVPVAVVS
jgi:hypothetical protein